MAAGLNAKVVDAVLGLEGVSRSVDAKMKRHGTLDWEYHDANGEVMLFVHEFASLARFQATRDTLVRNGAAPVADVGVEGFHDPATKAMCAKSGTKAACITLDTYYWTNKIQPSENQIKQLLRAAI
ncbi:MAG: hypothetical protein ACOY3E_01815 [Pseudomonadota bacterium]